MSERLVHDCFDPCSVCGPLLQVCARGTLPGQAHPFEMPFMHTGGGPSQQVALGVARLCREPLGNGARSDAWGENG